MKGIIILPTFMKQEWFSGGEGNKPNFNKILSANAPFYYSMKDTFGFTLRYADEVDVDSDTDIVFMFGVPYHNRPKLIPGLLELNKKIKLVMWPGDLQCYGNKTCLENRLKVFNRCDLIISPVYEYFVKSYPQFLSKYRLMPKFFAPHARYVKLNFNNKPIMKCLLSGALNSEVYPLRSNLLNTCKDVVDYKPSSYVGDAYAHLLNSYFCCVATPSIFNYAVSKYYEIPATGSLLLANENIDSEKAGFVPYKHYVPITTNQDACQKIKECLKNPEDYEAIRKEGMAFVRNNHSVNNRMEFLKDVFNELLNGSKNV